MRRLTHFFEKIKSTKLLLALCGVLLGLLLMLGSYGINIFSQLASDFVELKDNDLHGATDLTIISQSFWKLRFSLREYLSSTIGQKTHVKERAGKYAQDIDMYTKDYTPFADTEFEKRWFNRWTQSYASFTKTLPTFYSFGESANTQMAEKTLFEKIDPYFNEALASLDNLIEFQSNEVSNRELMVVANIRSNRLIFIFLVFLSILIAIIISIFSVTRIGEAIEQIKDSEEQLRLCIEAGHMGVWYFDLKENKIVLSEPMKAIFGLTATGSSFLQEDILNIIHPDDQVAMKKRFQDHNKGDFQNAVDYRIVLPDGRIRWIHSESNYVTDQTGTIERVMGVSADITDRKEAEILAQESQLLKMEALSKMSALGDITGGIAHEINNPLTIIQMVSDHLQKMLVSGHIEAGTAKKLGDRMRDATTRISNIVSGLSVFLRDGSVDTFTPINVKTLLDETLSFCMDKVKRNSVTLTVEPFKKDVQIQGHQTELSQVIVNLVSNAVDAIEKFQEKWIRIAVSDDEDFVEISITDSGKGIPPEVLKKMFTQSFTTKPSGRGTGLGLGICNRIIENHHGKIYVEDACKNTQFVIRLPKIQPDEVTDEPMAIEHMEV